MKEPLTEDDIYSIFFPEEDTDSEEVLAKIDEIIDKDIARINKMSFDKYPQHPIFLCSMLGWSHLVKYFVRGMKNEQKENIFEKGELALFGINNNDNDIILFLLDNGFDPNKVIHDVTLLEICACNRNIEQFKMLQEHGATASFNNFSAILNTFDRGQYSSARILINSLEKEQYQELCNKHKKFEIFKQTEKIHCFVQNQKGQLEAISIAPRSKSLN